MRRVALLHFTAEPCVGGVEHVMEEQRRILSRRGVDVRIIVGAGGEGDGVIRLPELLPPPAAHSTPIPDRDDPQVRRVATSLEWALDHCQACWIHNALTVYLHPALTVALLRLIDMRPDLRWTAFCHDLTARTAFWRDLSATERSQLRLPQGSVRYVADCGSGRDGLARLAHVLPEDVSVMPPPLDSDWLTVTPDARTIVGKASDRVDPLILVPSKLLPHKGLETAVLMLASLEAAGELATLVITGAPSPHQPDVSERIRSRICSLAREAGVGDRVVNATDVLGRPPGRLTVRDLMLLSDLVFLPSTEEGYGLPLQEAIALRAPVICSDIPSFREIGQGCANFFPRESTTQEIAELARQILTSPSATARRRLLRLAVDYEERLLELV